MVLYEEEKPEEERERILQQGQVYNIQEKNLFGLRERIPGVCQGCMYSMIHKHPHKNTMDVYCQLMYMRSVPSNLTLCSRRQSHGDMSLHEMSRVAWPIEVKKSDVGFKVGGKHE